MYARLAATASQFPTCCCINGGGGSAEGSSTICPARWHRRRGCHVSSFPIASIALRKCRREHIPAGTREWSRQGLLETGARDGPRRLNDEQRHLNANKPKVFESWTLRNRRLSHQCCRETHEHSHLAVSRSPWANAYKPSWCHPSFLSQLCSQNLMPRVTGTARFPRTASANASSSKKVAPSW